MKKLVIKLVLALFCFCTYQVKAQHTCGTEINHQLMMKFDTSYSNHFLNFEKLISEKLNDSDDKLDNTVYYIPVVVHVFHLGEQIGSGYNISDSVIFDAVRGLNERWRNLIGQGVDLGIEFCMASTDPFGNLTNGIVRIDASNIPLYSTGGVKMLNFSACDGVAVDDTIIKNLSTWPVTDYYNIWVVNDICGNVAGYAYFPWGGKFDGALMMYTYMNGAFNTLSHELGHGFNLQHTFYGDGGNSFCPTDTSCIQNGDFVCDTPPHKSGDCGEINPCSSDGVWDNSRYNYMSGCPIRNRFTQGQKNRVRAAAEIYPRSSLTTSASQNCQNTHIYNSISIDETIAVYPNPFNVTTTIKTSKMGEFILYDIYGRIVNSYEITSEYTELKKNNLKAGVYYYKFGFMSGKIVIQ